jgi:flagellar hook-basal body complex protein FliE
VREGNESFGALLRDKVDEINRMKLEADDAVARVSLSDSGSIHEAMIALEKADISFKAMIQVRNRILEAYQEIMRIAGVMPVTKGEGWIHVAHFFGQLGEAFQRSDTGKTGSIIAVAVIVLGQHLGIRRIGQLRRIYAVHVQNLSHRGRGEDCGHAARKR